MDLRQLLSENYTVEAGLEAASRLTCQGDITSILATCQEDVELLELLRVVQWADSHCATVLAKIKLSDCFESLWMQESACSIA